MRLKFQLIMNRHQANGNTGSAGAMAGSTLSKGVSASPRRATRQRRLEYTEPREQSQSELAYERIRDAIVTLQLKPGEYLNCSALEARFRLGRTPVVRALDRLMLQGLVEVMPRKGVTVSPLSLDEALSVIDVRRINEPHCVQLAAERIDGQTLEVLEAILGDYDMAARNRSLPALLAADRAFHETIASASGNAVLANLLAVLHARSQRFWAMSLSRQPHIGDVAREHAEIVACLRSRDPPRARSAMESHIESFRRNLLSDSRP
jgi:DNA-binding GntR family transcriptional regulator